MRVDIYKRLEDGNRISYLAVPHGNPLPQEVTNTDWLADERDIDLGQDTAPLFHLTPDDALAQIKEKGYAITHLRDQ